jgi:plastocyanin
MIELLRIQFRLIGKGSRMNGRRQSTRLLIGITVLVTAMMVGAISPTEAVGPKKFTLISVNFDDTDIWLPGSLLVYQGDEVELTLINKLDVPHGFKIDVFGIESVIEAKSKSTVKFTAKTIGVHPYVCQLHPLHIGGQIQVIAK